MKTMTLEEFHAAIKAQAAASNLGIRAICPVCGKVQTPQDLIDAGAGKDFEEVEKDFMFSCVGRFNKAGPFKGDNSKGCDWTLGGLLRLHNLEIITPDGTKHPVFELAA